MRNCGLKILNAPLCLCDNDNIVNYYIGYTIFFLLSFTITFLLYNFNTRIDNSQLVNLVFCLASYFIIAIPSRLICTLNYKENLRLYDSDDDERTRFYDVNLYN